MSENDDIPLVSAYVGLYPWQRKFIAAGLESKQRMVMAGNRVGKTLTAGVELAFHLLGRYPKDWPGVRLDFPPTCWALGVSGEQLRDVVQKILFGAYDGVNFSGGLIAPFSVKSVLPAQGTPKLAKDIRIHHKNGTSTLSLKSYGQSQAPLMGADIDIAWIDEEPQDPLIYPQVLTRTLTGNKGQCGYVVITETPELGATELALQFMEELKPGQFFMNVTWDDAPHLGPEEREQILSAYPAYQREMREKGIPTLGQGRIYTVAEERFSVDPFPIPDHWYRCAAIDFGLGHPTAVVWVAYDRDADVIYVTDLYKMAEELPAVHTQAIRARERCPLIYPADGDNREKGSGEALADVYRECGVEMTLQFDNPDGSKFVEPGILEVHNRLRTGRLKVFRHLADWFAEYRLYHTKNGKIVKVRDDAMDATRYAVVSVPRYGLQREIPEDAYLTGIPRRTRPKKHRAYNS